MGWGKVLAEARILSNPAQPEIPCPLCGQGMQWENVAWFCRSGPWRPSGISREPCAFDQANSQVREALEKAQERFFSLPRGDGGWEDGFQFFASPHGGIPAVHAILVVDGMMVATAQFVRGHRGVTNFSVIPLGDPAEVVRAFKEGAKWILAPWFDV